MTFSLISEPLPEKNDAIRQAFKYAFFCVARYCIVFRAEQRRQSFSVQCYSAVKTKAGVSSEKMECKCSRSRRGRLRQKDVFICYELSESWAVCRQSRAVRNGLHYTTKNTLGCADEESEFRKKLALSSWSENLSSTFPRENIFLKLTLAIRTKVCGWKREWPDPSRKQSPVLFLVCPSSVQSSLTTFASERTFVFC